MARQVKACSRAEFDSIDTAFKKAFGGTICERISLPNFGEFYREIAISEDKRMMLLRIGDLSMPIPFKNIGSIEAKERKTKTGSHLETKSGNNWALTGAAAALGWMAFQTRTSVKQVDDYDVEYCVWIDLYNHPTDKQAIYFCQSSTEAKSLAEKIKQVVEKYYFDGKPQLETFTSEDSIDVPKIKIYRFECDCGYIFTGPLGAYCARCNRPMFERHIYENIHAKDPNKKVMSPMTKFVLILLAFFVILLIFSMYYIHK